MDEMKYYTYLLLDQRKPGKYTYDGLDMSFLYRPVYVGKGCKKHNKEKHRYEDHITDARFVGYKLLNFIKLPKTERTKSNFWKTMRRHQNIPLKRYILKIEKETGNPPVVILLKRDCTSEQALTFEDFYMKGIGKIRDGGPLFNKQNAICPEGEHWMITEETRKKMSESAKGKYVSEHTRQKLREARKKYVFTDEIRKKISEALTGREFSEETKKKMSKVASGRPGRMKGKHHTGESIKKMSESKKGQRPTGETRQKLSETRRGRKHSEETKQKIGAGNMGKVYSAETREKISKIARQRTGERNGRYVNVDESLLIQMKESGSSIQELSIALGASPYIIKKRLKQLESLQIVR